MTPYLTRLKELADAATPGEWFEVDDERILVDARGLSQGASGLLAEVYDPASLNTHQTKRTVANARLIAASRTALPKLIEAVEVMRGALENIANQHRSRPFDGFDGVRAIGALNEVGAILGEK